MSNTKVINLSSMRTTGSIQNGLPKSPLLIGNRIGRQLSNSTNSSTSSSLSTQSAINNAVRLRMATSNKIPTIKLQDESPKVTPRLGRRLKDISNTNGVKNLSPLRSPQLIRSTRVETNNWINSNKIIKSSSNTVNANGIHSKSPGSGTSVESIVPKYQPQLNQSCCTNGVAQKRAYNLNKTSNKLPNKIVNTRNGNLCNGNINGSTGTTTTSTTTTMSMRSAINGNQVKKTLLTNGTVSQQQQQKVILKSTASTSSNTSSSSSSTKSFSSKFPNGLPFEDEFYHFRNNSNNNNNNNNNTSNHLRCNNHHHNPNNKNNRSSIASDTSFSNNSSHSDESVGSSNTVRTSYSSYEDEFARKPSNEPLYVDFTLKSLDKVKAAAVKSGGDKGGCIPTKTTYKLNNNDCFCEFESIESGYGKFKINQQQNGNMDKEDPVVYVAVASWVPKCNRLPILEPTNENIEYVHFILLL